MVVRLLPPRPDSRPKKPGARSCPGGYILGHIGLAWLANPAGTLGRSLTETAADFPSVPRVVL
jgi:hypothetical protein